MRVYSTATSNKKHLRPLRPVPGAGKASSLVQSIRETGLRYFYLILAANLAGTIFGVFYYLPQLSTITPWIWIFVADSPIATLLFAAAFTAETKYQERGFLSSLAFVGNLKYGVWTCGVLLLFSGSFLGEISFEMYMFLLVSHLGMCIQAFALKPQREWFLAGPMFYAVNDVLDYTWLIGSPVHSLLPQQTLLNGSYTHPAIHSSAAILGFSATMFSAIVYGLRMSD